MHAPSRSQADEPSTRRRLRCLPQPPLRPLTHRLNAFCSIASTYFFGMGLAVLLRSSYNFDVCRLNDFKVSDSDCCHHDQNCAAVHLLYSCCRSLHLQLNADATNSICVLYYYTVAEMRIFLSEVDLSRLAKSRWRVYSSQSVDWQLFSRLSRLSQSMVCKVSRSYAQRLTLGTIWEPMRGGFWPVK